MYVLMYHGLPLACSQLEERLNEQMAAYTAAQQAEMSIRADVPELT